MFLKAISAPFLPAVHFISDMYNYQWIGSLSPCRLSIRPDFFKPAARESSRFFW